MEGSVELRNCDRSYAGDMRECRRFDCDYKNLKTDSVSVAKVSDHDIVYPLFANASDCHMKWRPSPQYQPKECPACPVGDPIVYDGVPIDYEMQSFYQSFQICDNPRDRGNEFIKNRNLWNEQGPVEFSERPAYKECGPTVEQLTRDGRAINRSGIATTARNLIDTEDESDLIGLGKFVVRSDAMIHDKKRQMCLTDTRDSRRNMDSSLEAIFEQTSIDKNLFRQQNNRIRESTGTVKQMSSRSFPKVFNNCSRAKMMF